MDLRLGTSDVPVLIRAWKLTDGVRAEAVVAGTNITPIDLRPRHYSYDPADNTALVDWPMVRGLPQRLGDEDCFGIWKDLVFGAFVDARFGERTDRKRSDAERAEMSGLARQLKTLARALAIHAADTCDPALRGLALRFPTGTRLQIYAWLAGDPSGRLRAMAASCPGPLLLAIGANELGMQRTVGTILDGILSGVTAREVTERAVGEWVRGLPLGLLDHWQMLAPRCSAAPVLAAGLEPMLVSQRSLVLAAGHGVNPSMLVEPPPIAFHADDVPVRTRANARWFRMMKTSALAWRGVPVETDVRHTLSSLLSRKGLALFGDLPPTWRVSDGVDALLEFVLVRRLNLDARTDLTRLLAEAIPWYGTMRAAEPSRGKYDRFRLYCAGREAEALRKVAS